MTTLVLILAIHTFTLPWWWVQILIQALVIYCVHSGPIMPCLTGKRTGCWSICDKKNPKIKIPGHENLIVTLSPRGPINNISRDVWPRSVTQKWREDEEPLWHRLQRRRGHRGPDPSNIWPAWIHQCVGPPPNNCYAIMGTKHYFRHHNWLCGWCHRRTNL